MQKNEAENTYGQEADSQSGCSPMFRSFTTKPPSVTQISVIKQLLVDAIAAVGAVFELPLITTLSFDPLTLVFQHTNANQNTDQTFKIH